MQLPFMRSKLIWLLFPAISMAATPPSATGGVTNSANGVLGLMTPQVGRAAYCKHDDQDPYRFVSSLNNTFPDTPNLSQSDITNTGFSLNPQSDFTFDCFLELPTGVVVFEVKGDINSHLKTVFEVWISILIFNYKVGVFNCDLLDVDKDPCAFNIDTRYFKGQGALYAVDDADDPKVMDLCLKVYGWVHVPYTRVTKSVDFNKCFAQFPKPDTPQPPSTRKRELTGLGAGTS